MFYQPDRKMTIVVLTNFYGADPYAIAKALYETVPDFLCGNTNKKEDKIQVCFQGQDICIARSGAPALVKKGAYLGGCDQTVSKAKNNIPNAQAKELQNKPIASPNPFTDHATLSFSVMQQGPVTLRVYDMNGRLVSTLFNRVAEKGSFHQVTLEAGKLAAGVYIARLQTAEGVSQQKIVLRK
jgi:hypothetical protein